jgi:hypothetical protein
MKSNIKDPRRYKQREPNFERFREFPSVKEKKKREKKNEKGRMGRWVGKRK